MRLSKRWQLALWLGLSVVSPGAARAEEAQGAPRRITLAALLAQADGAAPEVQESLRQVEEARAGRLAAGLLPNPELAVGADNVPLRTPSSASRWDVTTLHAGLSQLVELGGKRSARIDVSEREVAAAGLESNEVRRQLHADVREAYWGALRAQGRAELAAEVERRIAETLTSVRARASAGDLAEADAEKLELERRRAAVEQQSAESLAIEARAALYRRVALPADPVEALLGEEAAPVAVPALEDTEHLVDALEQRRPDLVALKERLRRQEDALRLEHSRAIPDLTLGASLAYSPTEIASGASSTVGISASIPLAVFDRNQGGIAKGEVDLARARTQLELARLELRRDVALVRARLTRTSATAEQVEREVLPRAQRAAQVARSRYLEGGGSLLEVLEAERTFLDARGDLADARLARTLAVEEVGRLLGADGPANVSPTPAS